MNPPLPTAEERAAAATSLKAVRETLNGVLFGQETLVDLVVTALLARGHVLLEGPPGLGKTELVRSLGRVLGLEAARIQFTPDLLPGDITGNPMLREVDGERRFVFQKGPLFGNLVLADEINRASPKTQSALLEAMQEQRVTSMGERHALPEPFFVIATQNPIELEGTYPLPEAQLDRFLFKLNLQAGGVEILQRIVENRRLGEEAQVESVLRPGDLRKVMELAGRVYLPEAIANYIARLVDATRPGRSRASSALKYGASPRAAIGMAAAARARALLEGRENVTFDDVRAVAVPVIRHRVVVAYAAKLDGATGTTVAEAVLEEVPKHPDPLPPLVEERG